MNARNRVQRFSPTKLKRRRKAIGVSPGDIDEACAFRDGRLEAIEDGATPDLDEFLMICAALDVPVESLLAGGQGA